MDKEPSDASELEAPDAALEGNRAGAHRWQVGKVSTSTQDAGYHPSMIIHVHMMFFMYLYVSKPHSEKG